MFDDACLLEFLIEFIQLNIKRNHTIKKEEDNLKLECERIRPRPIRGRIRMLARWTKRALWFLKEGHFDFFKNAINAQLVLLFFTLRDIILRRKIVTCNICGWSGHNFYPHVCAGFYDRMVICPGCDCLDRYRTYAAILKKCTDFFSPDTFVIEVAPVLEFQEFCLKQKSNKNYISFDIQRFAIEKGDITNMRFKDNTVDYFLCSDVLDYVKDDVAAFRQVWRILKPGGLFIIRVAVDRNLQKTLEYESPCKKNIFHTRLYGRDFFKKVSAFGFEVSEHSAAEYLSEDEIKKFGLCRSSIFFAKKVTQH